MNFRKLKDNDLIDHALRLAKNERETLLECLSCLREIERRRLFSSLGCTSLFDFSVRKLGYSEDQALRRIQAMRLIKTIPEVRPLIASGYLTLAGIGIASAHIRREEEARGTAFSVSEKLHVVQLISGKSKRAAEKALLEISVYEKPPKADSAKVLSGGFMELRMTIKQSTWENIQIIRNALAHKYSALSLGTVFGITCQFAVDNLTTYPPAPAHVKTPKSPLHREVWERDQGKCTNCGSTHALQVDHIHPKALGGEDTLENLRLLCRNCNQRAAIEIFGVDKMEEFLN